MDRGRLILRGAMLGLLISLLTVPSPDRSEASTPVLSDFFLNLNGTSQSAYASDNAIFEMSNRSFTFEAWIRPSAGCVISDECMIVNKESSWEYAIKGGEIQYAIANSAGSWVWNPTNVMLTEERWRHVAFVKNVNTLTIYLEGRQVFTVTNATSVPSTVNDSNRTFSLGSRESDARGSYFGGGMDEVRIWHSARTQAQILANMNSYLDTSTANLAAYYDFNEGSGSTLTNRDSAPAAGSNLTIYNSPTWTRVSTSSIGDTQTVVTFPRSYIASTSGWPIPANINRVEALVVAGGGGGGYNSGGGGSGGAVMIDTALAVTGTVAVTVGVGGLGAIGSGGSVTRQPTTGGSSSFSSLQATGGNPGANYTSGSAAGGAAVNGFGAGGAGAPNSSTAGSAGSSGRSATTSGSTQVYGGGGGGGGWTTSTAGGNGGSGGGGGGGGSNRAEAVAGTNLLGGGGGGSRSSITNGADGGTGVVIIRYLNDQISPTISEAPSITSTPSASSTYRIGETLTVRISFSETVVVTGTPKIALQSASNRGTPLALSYISGSGTTNLNFSYTVSIFDSALAGIGIAANSLETTSVASTSIRDSVGNEANLSHVAISTTTSHKINGFITPTISVEPVDTVTTLSRNATFRVVATSPDPNATLTYQWQDSSTTTSNFSNISGANSATLTLSNLLAENDGSRLRVIVTATRLGQSDSTTSSSALLRVNSAITLSGGSNISTSFGIATSSSSISASGGTGSKTFTYAPLISGISIDPNTGVISLSSTAPRGSYTRTITATDEVGATATQSIVITITTGISSLDLELQGSVRKGSVVTLTATTNALGSVRFAAKNRAIPGCVSRAVNAGTLVATCSWRVKSHGEYMVSATFISSDANWSNATEAIPVLALKRISR